LIHENHEIFSPRKFLAKRYSRAAIIKLGTEDEEIHCLKQGEVAAVTRESIRRYTTMLATVTYTKPGPLRRC